MDYYMMDGTGNYQNTPQPKNKPKKKFGGNIIVILFIIILIAFFVIIFFTRSSSESSFSKYEREMTNRAKQYVSNNSITTEKEIYFDVSKLNIDLPNNCSLLSGVIYDGKNYTPNLICNNYESEIVNNNVDDKSDFKLIGSSVLVLLKGMEYYELGYECSDPVSIVDGDISEEGVYNIYYVIEKNDLILTRKVIVLDNESLYNAFPAINISGDNVVTLEKGNEYTEEATAIDSTDGDLTEKIIKINNVDINNVGEYKVIYSVRNSLGFTTFASKKVMVIDPKVDNDINIVTSLSNSNITNKNIKIKVSIVGEQYQNTKLPDGKETTKKTIEYEVEKNGTYEFLVYTQNGEETKKTVKVTNIDKTTPEGTCEAIIYDNKTSINVTIKSFNYIVGYNYYIDKKGSGYIEYNYYDSNVKDPTSIYVMAKDYIGNKGKITCTKTDKKTKVDPRGIRTVLSEPPRLKTAISGVLARKGYTMDDFNACIYKRVVEAGPYTRYGVAAAAFGLIDCSYKMTGYSLPYNHSSGKVEPGCSYHQEICGKLGIAPYWGSAGGTCNPKKDGTKQQCYHGLNCATFVRWSMCNGGMDLCDRGDASAFGMVDKKYFPEADAVGIKGNKVTHVYGIDYSGYTADQLVRMLKPGDVIGSSEGGGHAIMVVGYDDTGIYTAENGYKMRKLKYSTLTSGVESYRLMFLDRYYANPKNYNNLYG